MDNNEEMRKDEISALSAIYDDNWKAEDLQNNCFSITLNSDIDTLKSKTLVIQFKLPLSYPEKDKPSFTISAPWMTRQDKTNLIDQLNILCDQHSGESILYILIEQAKETLNNIVETAVSSSGTIVSNETESHSIDSPGTRDSNTQHCDIPIFHGNTLVDRKSVFQAHLASVHSVEDVQRVLTKLMENRKIQAATHNMWAYRLSKDSKLIQQNCDDDGETHAGSRLLHLLQIVDAKNVLVIVSRWYGGIQLGPDRFKHINNVTRQLLLEHNYVSK